MKILVKPGETLRIGFAFEDGSEADGEFTLFYDTKEHPNKLILQETGGLPGSIKGKADEILYEEDFTPDEDDEGPVHCTLSKPTLDKFLKMKAGESVVMSSQQIQELETLDDPIIQRLASSPNPDQIGIQDRWVVYFMPSKGE